MEPNSEQLFQPCAICSQSISHEPRYPNRLCTDCSDRATDHRGRRLLFSNLGLSGGYSARYTDDQTPYSSHECFVDGKLCHADEHRFGGVVLELAET